MPDGDSKSTTSTTPWGPVQPYLLGDKKKGIPGILPEAAGLYGSGDLAAKPYFASTVAPMSSETNQALTGIANRAQAGSPLNAAAGAETLKTLGGGYLEGNPYLDAIRARGRREASQIAGQFGAGGRTGSGAMADSVAAGYTSAVAPYEYGGYENERGRMVDAMHFAPTLAEQDYRDLGALQNVGQQRQAQSQAELSDQVQRWQQEQQRQAANLAAYQQIIGAASSPYNVQTSTMPGQSIGQTVLGSLLGAGGLAANFYTPGKGFFT